MAVRIASLAYLVWAGLVFTIGLLFVLPFITVFSSLKSTASLRLNFIFLKLWAGFFCFLCLIRVKRVSAPDHQDYRGPKIFVCNHRSYLDSVALVKAIPEPFKPLGKIEMRRVPLFGLIYEKIVVMIDRTDKESRSESVERLRNELRQGTSVLIFPEGRMNRGPEPLTGFYDGAFRLALETGTPIVPVVLLNTSGLLPRTNPTAFRPGSVTCLMDAPVSVSGMGIGDLDTLKDRIYQRMMDMISKRGL